MYDREGIYGAGGQDHPDNAVRFGVLARAALDYAVGLEAPPAIVHAHDWQTGLVPVLLRTRYSVDPVWQRIPSVFTVHNLAYQGVFPAETLSALDLSSELFSIDGLEFWNQVSFLKGGINFADAVTTVSAAYAREILTPEYGEGLDGLLVHRRQLTIGDSRAPTSTTPSPRTRLEKRMEAPPGFEPGMEAFQSHVVRTHSPFAQRPLPPPAHSSRKGSLALHSSTHR